MTARYLLLGALAGALAVPIFHQLTVLVLNAMGLIAATPWSFRPAGAWGVPQLLNQMFWGGMWGLLFGAIMLAKPSLNAVLIGLLVGMLGAGMANLTLLPLLRGQPMPIGDLNRWWRPMLITGIWGIGMGLIFLGLRGRVLATR